MQERLSDLYEIVKQNKEGAFDSVIEERASFSCLYHLSEIRANLVSFLPIGREMCILERNAGCGALTRHLLGLAGRVVSVADSEECAAIIKERCRDAGERLTVCVRSIPEDISFDLILLVGDVWRYAKEFSAWRCLLKTGGKLIIADANRLGLQYLAGCQEEYRGGYFAGVEGYPGDDAASSRPSAEQGRCYTRGEYIAMLRDAGYDKPEVYYPYPDFAFPSVIFSDRRLPERGELSDNRRNFKRDRIQLFDERRVYDTLLAEGLFEWFSNAFLMAAGIEGEENSSPRERTIYVKYSNERAAQFRIRTDIVEETSGRRYVCKYALAKEGEQHIRRIRTRYGQLGEAYEEGGFTFCRCAGPGEAFMPDESSGECAGKRSDIKRGSVAFAYVEGETLQERMERAVGTGDNAAVKGLICEYIRRVRTYGGNVPFAATPAFVEVFGDVLPEPGIPCAVVSDIDLIFSNIMVGPQVPGGPAAWEEQAVWTVIDYEWTFDFPVPKDFIVYRALYFAYYQILNDTDFTLQALYEMAGLTEEQTEVFGRMEAHFQAYLGKGALPVRNMQRLLGTKIVVPQELGRTDASSVASLETAGESAWIKVRRIEYHIDRQEFQDGSMICCGWAFASTKDGRYLPVDIRVTDGTGAVLPAEIHRLRRPDVAQALKIHRVSTPLWGFDCVWLAAPEADFTICFSLGNGRASYRSGAKKRAGRSGILRRG